MTTTVARTKPVDTQVISSTVAPTAPRRCGTATFTIDESIAPISVPKVTLTVTSHLLTGGRATVATVRLNYTKDADNWTNGRTRTIIDGGTMKHWFSSVGAAALVVAAVVACGSRNQPAETPPSGGGGGEGSAAEGAGGGGGAASPSEGGGEASSSGGSGESASASASAAPEQPVPTTCEHDADCTLSTFSGCCKCCPGVPHAFLRGKLASLQAKCAKTTCPSCNTPCGPDPDLAAYLVTCQNKACVAVPQ